MKAYMLAALTALLLSGCFAANKDHYHAVADAPEEIHKLKQADKKIKEDIHSLQKAVEDMRTSMKNEIKAKSVSVNQNSPASIQVIMQQQLMFASGSSDISSAGRKTLVKFAEALKHAPASANIRIVGHTDNLPVSRKLKHQYADNWALSTARAAAVARFLVWGTHLEPKRLHIEGSGSTQPIASNDTEEGRAKNRRIELFVEINA